MKSHSNKRSEMINRLEEVLLKIDNLSKSFPILVEGKKDERTLRQLGITGIIVHLSGQSLFETAERMAGFGKVIILTDFDKRGEKIASQVSRYLEEQGTFPIMTYRTEILSITKGRIRQIEGLSRFINHLREKNQSLDIDLS
ncbi:MAG: toprim domain-containing protein [Candidatus Hodarchaeota archaeon]